MREIILRIIPHSIKQNNAYVKGCTKLSFSKTMPLFKCIHLVFKCHFKIKVIKKKSDFYGNVYSLLICQNLNAVIKKSASLSNFCIVTDPCPKKLEYKKRNFNACNSLWTSAPLKQSITHQRGSVKVLITTPFFHSV